jgi:hypothetical protein
VPRTRDESLVAKARDLASQGMTQAQVSAALSVPARTLKTWGIDWPMGRPKVSDEHASERTARRRRQEEAKTMAGTIDYWAESQAQPGKHGAWWEFGGEWYALVAEPSGDGFRWEVYGPRGDVPAPCVDSGGAATLEDAERAAEESQFLAGLVANAGRRASQRARAEAERDLAAFAARVAEFKAHPERLVPVSDGYWSVLGEDGREAGTVLGGGPTRDTAFKCITTGNVGIAPEHAPGGYAATLEEAAAGLP